MSPWRLKQTFYEARHYRWFSLSAGSPKTSITFSDHNQIPDFVWNLIFDSLNFPAVAVCYLRLIFMLPPSLLTATLSSFASQPIPIYTRESGIFVSFFIFETEDSPADLRYSHTLPGASTISCIIYITPVTCAPKDIRQYA